nr:hypothetical protein [Tanacetum cinerariifolium]
QLRNRALLAGAVLVRTALSAAPVRAGDGNASGRQQQVPGLLGDGALLRVHAGQERP